MLRQAAHGVFGEVCHDAGQKAVEASDDGDQLGPVYNYVKVHESYLTSV